MLRRYQRKATPAFAFQNLIPESSSRVNSTSSMLFRSRSTTSALWLLVA